MAGITKTQREILGLLILNDLTLKEIAQRRGVSKPAISKTIKKLIAKGYIGGYKRGGLTKGGVVGLVNPLLPSSEYWRYHALQLEIRPYYFYKRYYEQLKERGGHSVKMGAWRYCLYYKKIILWLEAGEDFKDPVMDAAIMKANLAINGILPEIARLAGFEYLKDGRASIKLLKHHLALTNAPEADIVTENKVYVTFRGLDGKVWLVYDKSKGLKEREFIHGRAVDDAEALEQYLTDLREYNPPTNSQLAGHIERLAVNFEYHSENLRSHVTAINSLSNGVNRWNRSIRKLSRQLNNNLRKGGPAAQR